MALQLSKRMSGAAAWILPLAVVAFPPRATGQEPQADLSQVPGSVVHHAPASNKVYIGSPSLVQLDDGTLLAKCDEFGPGSTEHTSAVTHVFRSTDAGATWKRISTIEGLFWSNLFEHRGRLYQIGTTHHHGNLVALASDDGGATWTRPAKPTTGLLREGAYHTAPMPMLKHEGRLWRAVEDAGGGDKWGIRYRPLIMSIPLDGNLLDAGAWELTPYLAGDTAWLEGKFGGWLEGNALVGRDGEIVNLLRVEVPQGGVAALLRFRDARSPLEFDPASGFIAMPGGAKKFTVRFDPVSKRYWSLVNDVPPNHGQRRASTVRNRLSLASSADLREWRIERKLIEHPDTKRHGFQYPDWIFAGDDILALVRTAHDDGLGGAHSAHDANLLTFHVVTDFRGRAE
jgi:hypothetical protein